MRALPWLLVPILALGAWLLWPRSNVLPAVPSPAQDVRLASSGAQVEAGAVFGESSPGAAPRSVLETQAPEPAPLPPAADASPPMARIHGRFVMPGGVPASDVVLRLRGWAGNAALAQQHPPPKDWQNPPPASTDERGRFELRLDPPRAFQFMLEAESAGTAGARWRWHEIAPGAEVDVGTIQLAPAGSVIARMVDGDGNPIRAGWSIHAEGTPTQIGEGVWAVRRQANLDPSSGFARLEDLPPGAVKLTAHSRIANWIEGPVVEVAAGEETEAVLRYTGPDNSRRIVVVPVVSRFHAQNVTAGAIRLHGPGIEGRPALQIPHSSQSFAFDDLEPGVYSVEIDDPRFELWSAPALGPGSRVDAHLVGAAGVQVRVLDAASGEPIERYDLRLRFERSNLRPNEYPLQRPDEAPPADGLFGDLPAADLALVVVAEGYSKHEEPLGVLVRGELRSVVVPLRRGARLRGQVSFADGGPAPGVELQLAARGARPSAATPWRAFTPPPHPTFARGTSDAQGRFELEGLPGGEHVLHAIASPWLVATLEPLDLADGEERELNLTLPPSGGLRGRFLLPPGASAAGLQLELLLELEPLVESFISSPRATLELAPDGTFESGPLPPGDASLTLRGPLVMLPDGFSRSSGATAPGLELARARIEAGTPQFLELDLRDRWFGALVVRVTGRGAPLVGYVVEVRPLEAGGHERTGALTGADGTARVEALPPGEYLVSARPVEGSWSVHTPGPVRIESAGRSEVAIDARFAAGSVQLVGLADGEPVRERQLGLGPRGGPWRSVQTDGAGRLELELTEGEYELHLGATVEREFRVPLRWTVAGPDPTLLKVELP